MRDSWIWRTLLTFDLHFVVIDNNYRHRFEYSIIGEAFTGFDQSRFMNEFTSAGFRPTPAAFFGVVLWAFWHWHSMPWECKWTLRCSMT